MPASSGYHVRLRADTHGGAASTRCALSGGVPSLFLSNTDPEYGLDGDRGVTELTGTPKSLLW